MSGSYAGMVQVQVSGRWCLMLNMDAILRRAVRSYKSL
jgi:hypothetical protein